MEVYELPNKEFKITTIKVHNELRKMIHEQNEFNKKIENVKKNQIEFWR